MTRAEVHDMEHAEFVLWTRFHARRAQAKELATKMADR